MIQTPPHVVLFYDATLVVQRRAVSGVLRYANTFGPWHVTLNEIHTDTSIPKDCSGILACAPQAPLLKKIIRQNLPLVLINLALLTDDALRKAQALPHIKSDSKAFGRQAADFFLARTPRTFVYVGRSESPPWDLEREAAFANYIRQAGYKAHLYPRPSASDDATREAVRLQEWLKTLPKPLAIFAANDARAREVLTACQLAGITVPYEAQILGVDNDEWLCESTRPRLSSIPFSSEEGGYEAARMLDTLMPRNAEVQYHSGKQQKLRSTQKTKKNPLIKTIPPQTIVERESTDERIVDDSIVSHALSFIHLNKGLSIRVTDVAKEVKVTSGWLETRFRETLGTSVIEEISRIRLQTILHLICDTNTPPLEIARRCGFTNTSTLCRLIKKETGQTISAFRSKSFHQNKNRG